MQKETLRSFGRGSRQTRGFGGEEGEVYRRGVRSFFGNRRPESSVRRRVEKGEEEIDVPVNVSIRSDGGELWSWGTVGSSLGGTTRLGRGRVYGSQGPYGFCTRTETGQTGQVSQTGKTDR